MLVRPFVALSIGVLITLRLAIIFGTPSYDSFGDLSIYREVGELVVHGIDPYDPASRPELRQELRLNGHGVPASTDLESYNFYVGANLPGSTLLYGVIERFAESARGWRIALVLGDLSLLLSAVFFLRRNGIADRPDAQLALFLTVVCCPSLLYWGTLLAEDKQYQTALMILLAGFLSAPGKRPGADAAMIGVVGALSILFKAFGLFLAPVALLYFLRRPTRELLIAAVVATIVALPLIFYFDLSFITRMLDRLRAGGTVWNNFHGSPWQLVPLDVAQLARPMVCISLIALSVWAYVRGAIDLLNASAAICVVFGCLWLISGSMDRMNMAMVFAVICTATVSTRLWLLLSILNFAWQVPLYWQYGGERTDAIAAALFVAFYFPMLLSAPARRSLVTAPYPAPSTLPA